MSYDFLSFSEKGKGKGLNLPNLPRWFQYSFFLFFFFSFTGVGFVSFPSSLVLFSFPVQIPLRYVFNMSIVLIHRRYLYHCFFQYEVSFKEKGIKRRKEKKMCGRMKEKDNKVRYVCFERRLYCVTAARKGRVKVDRH